MIYFIHLIFLFLLLYLNDGINFCDEYCLYFYIFSLFIYGLLMLMLMLLVGVLCLFIDVDIDNDNDNRLFDLINF